MLTTARKENSERQSKENAVYDAAKQIRQILDETISSVGELDGRDVQEEVLRLVTEED